MAARAHGEDGGGFVDARPLGEATVLSLFGLEAARGETRRPLGRRPSAFEVNCFSCKNSISSPQANCVADTAIWCDGRGKGSYRWRERILSPWTGLLIELRGAISRTQAIYLCPSTDRCSSGQADGKSVGRTLDIFR